LKHLSSLQSCKSRADVLKFRRCQVLIGQRCAFRCDIHICRKSGPGWSSSLFCTCPSHHPVLIPHQSCWLQAEKQHTAGTRDVLCSAVSSASVLCEDEFENIQCQGLCHSGSPPDLCTWKVCFRNDRGVKNFRSCLARFQTLYPGIPAEIVRQYSPLESSRAPQRFGKAGIADGFWESYRLGSLCEPVAS
jgi:hypothetical protein